MRKSLKDLSWDISENEYRQSPFLSYSKLSQFFKNGPKALISNEKIDTPSLRFGSLTDTILTANEEFDDRFYVADIDKFSDAIRKIVEEIYLVHGAFSNDFSDITDDGLLEMLDRFEYQANWKPETRIKKLIELGSDYYTVLKYSTGKIVISPQEFSEAQQCVMTLKTHPFTYQIFECNEDEEIFYQLKFKANIFSVNSRCMFDIIRIDHKNKTIELIDLKTSGKSEESFEESFLSWNYWIQAQLYKSIILEVLGEDEYFGDFTLLDFKFLVINKNNLCPLIWDTVNIHIEAEKIRQKFGVTYQSLLQDANWHLQNGKFDYSRKSYENNGVNPIILKL